MKTIFQKWFPPFLMLVMALWFFGQMRAPRQQTFDFAGFGELPIIANGRVKPIDSLARNALLEIREKQSVNTEPWKSHFAHPKMISASEWLANVTMNPVVADGWPVFRIDHPDLISLLKLPEKDAEKKSDGKHYSWNQLQPMLSTLEQENRRVRDVEAPKRTAFDNAIAKLYRSAMRYVELKNTIQPADTTNWPADLANFERIMADGVVAARAQQAGQQYDKTAFTSFIAYIQRFQFMDGFEPALIVPPSAPKGDWQRMSDALLAAPGGASVAKPIKDYATLAGALAANQPDQFNAALRDLRADVAAVQPRALDKSRAEVFFNQMQPFYNATVIYTLAGLLAVFFWFNLSHTLRRAAVWLLWLAFVIHTTGLIYRMVLESRPPVTNLYSSAIFIGWGVVLLGLILEHLYKNGIGAVAASVIGFITLIIAHHLSLQGDTMEMMRAVLDSNFWLTIHVITVTVGYVGTFLSGFLGLIYVLRGFFTKTLDADTSKALVRMIYGVVCFATLFSFIGTVTGGIWADQSWGRFWGWDPKENGALIIVLWNAIILHLRWGGLVRERGIVNCAIFGNIITAWSWFGVNMLGIGLHSYGFTEAGFYWLSLFAVSQLAFIAFGLVPLKFWRSFKARQNSVA
jgi:ABC-type transport system involved in cytochrome c biogenesis permease subunit